jgi:hypothetical protein
MLFKESRQHLAQRWIIVHDNDVSCTFGHWQKPPVSNLMNTASTKWEHHKWVRHVITSELNGFKWP